MNCSFYFYAIPYWVEDNDNEEDFKSYSLEDEDSSTFASLMLSYYDDENDEDYALFLEDETFFPDLYMDDIMTGDDVEEFFHEDIAVDEMEGQLFSYAFFDEDGWDEYITVAMLFDLNQHKVITVLLQEFADAEYDLYDDFVDVVENIKSSDSPLPSETKESPFSPKLQEVSGDENSPISITNCYTVTTEEDSDILVVEFTFTNDTDKPQAFRRTYSCKAFQNSIECDDTRWIDGIDYNSDNDKEVLPNGTLTVSMAYELVDDSDVTILVDDFLRKKTYFTQKISLQ